MKMVAEHAGAEEDRAVGQRRRAGLGRARDQYGREAGRDQQRTPAPGRTARGCGLISLDVSTLDLPDQVGRVALRPQLVVEDALARVAGASGRGPG